MWRSRLGVVVALEAEAKILFPGVLPYNTLIEVDERLLMVVSGMGPERAAEAVRMLITAGVSGLVSWGTAGGLHPARQAGDLLLPERVYWSQREWPVDRSWHGELRKTLPVSSIAEGQLSVTEPCASVTAKAAARDAYPDAQAVDMESGAIAEAADRVGKPFVVIRSVVDPAGQALPVTATRSVDTYGRPRTGRLVRGLLRRPADIRDLIRLGGQMQRALKSLRIAAPCLSAEWTA